MKVSDYIASYFESKGVTVIFGYIGGMITHLVDSIANNKNLRFVQTYHEQTAAIAAEGYALESGIFGVAISTSGPGVTNMMTGIADAYFGSIPVVYISGQVNTYEYKYAKPIRQQGFQEMDVVSVVTPITKYAKLIDKAEDIRYELEKAVYMAMEGRKGPVMLDIPMDIQRADVNPSELKGFETPLCESPDYDFVSLLKLLCEAERPMLLLGAGCQDETTRKLLEHFLEATHIPVVTSLMGRGVIDETYPYYLGMVGSYGNRCANMGVANADLLITLGSRLDTRQTGAQIDKFLLNGRIIQVDIDKNELECHRLENRLKIHLNVCTFIQKLLDLNIGYRKNILWNHYLQQLKKRYNQEREIERFVDNKSPYHFMQELNELTEEEDIITCDVGQNQMWAAQTLQLKKGQRFVTSGGLAPMGFSLPAAIGMAFANPAKTIYSLNGDGGFHMAVQSLLLISQYKLKIKVIVMNNESLGMITQFQHLYFSDKMEGTTRQGGYWVPKLKEIAKAYGISYLRLEENEINDKQKMEAIKTARNILVEFNIKGLTTVSPKLEYDKPIWKPIPLLEPTEYETFIEFKKRNG